MVLIAERFFSKIQNRHAIKLILLILAAISVIDFRRKLSKLPISMPALGIFVTLLCISNVSNRSNKLFFCNGKCGCSETFLNFEVGKELRVKIDHFEKRNETGDFYYIPIFIPYNAEKVEIFRLYYDYSFVIRITHFHK